MPDRNNGFAANWWGVFCRAIRDFIAAFDVPVMAYCGMLIVGTYILAVAEFLTPDGYVTPEWWVGASGLFFLTVGGILIKHTGGFFIASRYNSPQGASPVPTGPVPDAAAPEKPAGA